MIRRRGAGSAPTITTRRAVFPTVVLALLLLACTESGPTALSPGTLHITASTTGSIVDVDGYMITLDGSRTLPVATNGSVSFFGVPTGDHEVSVGGIADNCNLEGSQPRTVTVAAGAVASVSLELTCALVLPKISFVSERDGNFEIYIMDLDGSNQYNLTNDPGEEGSTGWSPDGRKIVFSTHFETPGGEFPHGSDIYVMNSDGSGRVRLTDDPNFDNEATYSPDGSMILFSRQQQSSHSQGIWLMDADGTNKTLLLDEVWNEIGPVWSPDGSRIAYNTDRDGNWEIYTMDSDGSNRVRVTDSPHREVSPVWSPDGNVIVFVSDRDGDDEIYKMNPDGSGVLRLTHDPAEDSSPAWSPDGSRIGFVSKRDGGDWEVYIMGANGEDQTRLTNSPGRDVAPVFSPEILAPEE